MRCYVGITDGDWHSVLSRNPDLQEINFWQPGGNRRFGALTPGELFLFKLHSPRDFTVGGGVFSYSSLLPVSLAWETFGVANGADSLAQMRQRIERYRRRRPALLEDYTIGCILLERPFFLPEHEWVPIPKDWHGNIVQGKTYDLSQGYGRALWLSLQAALARSTHSVVERLPVDEDRYGNPIVVVPRRGQHIFRIMVTDAYDRRCAVTREKVLPVLEAAHIKPFAQTGPFDVSNGLLLRKDLHALFDRGYLTVTPARRLEVSERLKEEFDNGEAYKKLHGTSVWVPAEERNRPSEEYLHWHNEKVFRA